MFSLLPSNLITQVLIVGMAVCVAMLMNELLRWWIRLRTLSPVAERAAAELVSSAQRMEMDAPEDAVSSAELAQIYADHHSLNIPLLLQDAGAAPEVRVDLARLHRTIRRRSRARIVTRAIMEISAKVGRLSKSQANALIVGREFRKWAGPDGLDMRPTHITALGPLVEALFFVPNDGQIVASQVERSLAYDLASRSLQQISWKAVLYRYIPLLAPPPAEPFE